MTLVVSTLYKHEKVKFWYPINCPILFQLLEYDRIFNSHFHTSNFCWFYFKWTQFWSLWKINLYFSFNWISKIFLEYLPNINDVAIDCHSSHSFNLDLQKIDLFNIHHNQKMILIYILISSFVKIDLDLISNLISNFEFYSLTFYKHFYTVIIEVGVQLKNFFLYIILKYILSVLHSNLMDILQKYLIAVKLLLAIFWIS